MNSITTHILDTARGLPAAGVEVRLLKRDGAQWQPIGTSHTNNDGRARDLFPADETLQKGEYQLVFEVEPYFAALGILSFYPRIQIEFLVRDTNAHYHVPLLLSPFGFSTYRGS